MNNIRLNSLEWLDQTPLNSGETRIIEVSAPNSNIERAGVRGQRFFCFGVHASHTCTFRIHGTTESSFIDVPQNYDVLLTHAITAATFASCYDLTGVYANNNGWITISCPLIRLTLQDTAGANHTTLRFWAQCWG